MSQLGGYAQMHGPIVFGGVLIVFILQLQIFRKNMFGQSMQKAYSNTSQVLYNNLSLQISSLGMMCQADHYARRSDLFNQGRICKYCGVNMDTTDLESLKFLHGKCWQQYRRNGEVYPFPANVG